MIDSGEIILYTVSDIQRIFKIGRNKAYQLMSSSGFPSITINNRIYVTQENLKKWLDTYTGRKYIL